jgi:hypothetical protein
MQSIRSLMAGLIDYAGLYPPAALPMSLASEDYARSTRGEHEWILGRFICPASRLREFSQAASVMMPGTAGTSGYREHAEVLEPWTLSVIIDGELPADLETIDRFNAHHADEDHGRAVIDAIEMKIDSPDRIDAAMDEIPEDIYPFFEFPFDLVAKGDVRGCIAALAGEPIGAKIRTGGVTPEAFPSPAAIAKFMIACHAASVPFKATAGLHHPVRSEHPLTYKPDAPRGTMHGFLNVFLAATMLHAHNAEESRLVALLEEKDPGAFKFTDEGVRWNGLFAEDAHIAAAREAFCLSYGSCSFDEPVEDLKKLKLL